MPLPGLVLNVLTICKCFKLAQEILRISDVFHRAEFQKTLRCVRIVCLLVMSPNYVATRTTKKFLKCLHSVDGLTIYYGQTECFKVSDSPQTVSRIRLPPSYEYILLCPTVDESTSATSNTFSRDTKSCRALIKCLRNQSDAQILSDDLT